MTLYRKYRPQNFSELLGLEEIKKALSVAKSKNSLSHAYLFSGPRGTGKTTTARILAKLINCENLSLAGEPCGKCSTCQSIAEGRFLDLIEIDAASNRGIDEIRDLREKIKLSPTVGKYKVYIIDEVHMLTAEAFNALLKTLEEPPAHAVFILCTTEIHKLPSTIVSRCLRFDFKMPELAGLVALLTLVSKKEKIALTKEDALSLAKAARGAYRDALVLLEKYSSSDLEATLGKSRENLDLVEGLVKGESPKKLIEQLDNYLKAGVNIKTLTEGLIEDLRLMLLLKVGISDNFFAGLKTKEELEGLKNLASENTRERINLLLNLLLGSLENLKVSSIAQLPLEMVIVESSLIKEDKIKESKAKEEPNQEVEEVKVASSKEEEKVVAEVKTEEKEAVSVSPITLEKVTAVWSEVLKSIRDQNHSLEALLRNCDPEKMQEGELTLKVGYRFHKGLVEEIKNRNLIEKNFSEYLGIPIRIRCILGEREPKVIKKEELDNIKPVSDDELIKSATELFGSN